jgi:hypothetical protein
MMLSARQTGRLIERLQNGKAKSVTKSIRVTEAHAEHFPFRVA